MERRLPFLRFCIIWASYESMLKGVPFFSQGMQKVYLYTNDKGLDFGADPPCIKLCRVPFPL